MKKGNVKDFYTIGKLLGEGAYGKVYIAIQKATSWSILFLGLTRALDLKRAMKTIKKSVAGDRAKKILYEVNILKTLDHPHILNLLEVYQDEQFYYLVTEYRSHPA